MLYDHTQPRYLPHLDHAELLLMGLSPLASGRWIEPDRDAGRYYRNKLEQRARLGNRVYRAHPDSAAAQEELAALLLAHLLEDHPDAYRCQGDHLHCLAGGYSVPLAGEETLWQASLWVAEDLVIMQPRGDSYYLSAASLCSASGWRLEDKFDGSLAAIHAVIPGFDSALLPNVERFFAHLKVERPVERFNWSLQVGGALNRRAGEAEPDGSDGELYYRVERQTLRRLPRSGAVVFTIRVFLHPLSCLRAWDGALPALLRAVENCPPALQRYKGFDRIAGALRGFCE